MVYPKSSNYHSNYLTALDIIRVLSRILALEDELLVQYFEIENK